MALFIHGLPQPRFSKRQCLCMQCAYSDDRDVRLRSTFTTRTKAFLGFKVAGYTFNGTFMPLQSIRNTTTIEKVILTRKRNAQRTAR